MNKKDASEEAIVDGIIRFEDESKEEYLIDEILKLAELNFGFSIIPKNKVRKEDKNYQKIVDRMYKELKGKETENSTPRKYRYSKGTVRWLLEVRLYKYFLKKSNHLEDYQDEIKEAKANFSKLITQRKKEGNINNSDIETINGQMEEMKLRIALHYICTHCIDIDEALLASDISLLASESELPDDQVYLAWDRLTNNLGAYYKVEEKTTDKN